MRQLDDLAADAIKTRGTHYEPVRKLQNTLHQQARRAYEKPVVGDIRFFGDLKNPLPYNRTVTNPNMRFSTELANELNKSDLARIGTAFAGLGLGTAGLYGLTRDSED